MNSPSLRQFVDHALESRRIRFGDLQRLRRDILPGRIASREDAEMLLGLDRSIRTADRDWGDYLVGTVRDFAIWGMEPSGVVNGEKAAWLFAAVFDGGPTRNGRAIFREVTREARLIDEDAALVLAGGGMKRHPQTPGAEPAAPPGAAPLGLRAGNHAAA